jgi:signal peptidase I
MRRERFPVTRAVLAFVLTAALTLPLWGLVPRLWGWQPMIITSGSMAPSIRPGDVVLVEPLDGGPARVTSVITYDNGHELVTHRVVGRDGDGYVTKGDAVAQQDAAIVHKGQVVGEVRLLVPALGWPALQLRRSPLAAAAVCALVAVLFLVRARRALDGARVRRRRNPGRHRSIGPRTSRRSRRSRRLARPSVRGRAVAVSGATLVALSGLTSGQTSAAFTSTTNNGSNSVGTKSAFYAVAVRDAAPVAYWRLGESSGTAGADAMGTAALTYTSGLTLGRPGAPRNDGDTAVRFTSASHHGTAANVAALSMTGPFTVVAWAKAASYPVGSNARLVAKFDGSIVNYLLAWDSSGQQMRIVAENTGGTRYTANATVPNDSAWHMHVGTFDGTTLRLYRDGAQVATTAFTGTIRTNAAAATVGYTSQSMLGDFDEVAIWNRALSAAEISQLHALATA